jgi:hypothetical protein
MIHVGLEAEHPCTGHDAHQWHYLLVSEGLDNATQQLEDCFCSYADAAKDCSGSH